MNKYKQLEKKQCITYKGNPMRLSVEFSGQRGVEWYSHIAERKDFQS